MTMVFVVDYVPPLGVGPECGLRHVPSMPNNPFQHLGLRISFGALRPKPQVAQDAA
jgi:hypothetical protein